MTTGTARSKEPLHNFTMPEDLRWGNQKFLRCMKVNSDGRISPLRRFALAAGGGNPVCSDQRVDLAQPPRAGKDCRERGRERDLSSESMHGSHRASGVGRRFSDDDGGIAATRKKLMFDLQTAADKLKDAIFKDGFKDGEVSALPTTAASIDGEIQRPWNLRTRRAACKTPASKLISSSSSSSAAAAAAAASNDSGVRKSLTVDFPKSNSGFPQSHPTVDDKPQLRNGGGAAASTVGEKRDRPKFWVALSKSEIEEDFSKLLGHRPPRRPKKRAKIVQRQLDALFPGLWLTQVTPDMYKVNEAAQ